MKTGASQAIDTRDGTNLEIAPSRSELHVSFPAGQAPGTVDIRLTIKAKAMGLAGLVTAGAEG